MIIPLAIQYPLVDETTALGHVRLALFCSIFRKCVFLAGLLLLPALVSPGGHLPLRAYRRRGGRHSDHLPVPPLLPQKSWPSGPRGSGRSGKSGKSNQKLRHNWWRQPPKQAKMGPSGKECLI